MKSSQVEKPDRVTVSTGDTLALLFLDHTHYFLTLLKVKWLCDSFAVKYWRTWPSFWTISGR